MRAFFIRLVVARSLCEAGTRGLVRTRAALFRRLQIFRAAPCRGHESSLSRVRTRYLRNPEPPYRVRVPGFFVCAFSVRSRDSGPSSSPCSFGWPSSDSRAARFWWPPPGARPSGRSPRLPQRPCSGPTPPHRRLTTQNHTNPQKTQPLRAPRGRSPHAPGTPARALRAHNRHQLSPDFPHPAAPRARNCHDSRAPQPNKSSEFPPESPRAC